ncbi:CDP-glycerol glycerophosphotransferase family protein [Candidatus Neomarinimicrobiota bacterium]
MNIVFFTHHLYYLPQFIPVARAFAGKSEISFAIFDGADETETDIMRSEIRRYGWNLVEQKSLEDKSYQADILIIGQSRDVAKLVVPDTLAVLLFHGTGVKRIYYSDTVERIDLRFVESDYRREECLSVKPDVETVAVGHARLDPILKGEICQDYALPEGKGPRILYAPTFYPGSLELLTNHILRWPEDWQVVIKTHQFSLTLPKYAYQVKMLKDLVARRKQVTWLPLEAYNINTAFAWADVLVSEASATIIEFTALDKPIVLCDELYLRPHHKLLRKRFYRQRMDEELLNNLDFAVHSAQAAHVADNISLALKNPQNLSQERTAARDKLLGPCDGMAAQRIVKAILEAKAERTPAWAG